jgi:hypothetical protein
MITGKPRALLTLRLLATVSMAGTLGRFFKVQIKRRLCGSDMTWLRVWLDTKVRLYPLNLMRQ